MNEKVRITSEIVRIRGHFLIKLTDWQWSLAKHGIAAGQTTSNETIRMHLMAAQHLLEQIEESAHLLGFDKLGTHAERIAHLVSLYFEKGFGTIHSSKLLTDVIIDLNGFICACTKLTQQQTVLEVIDIPKLKVEPT